MTLEITLLLSPFTAKSDILQHGRGYPVICGEERRNLDKPESDGVDRCPELARLTGLIEICLKVRHPNKLIARLVSHFCLNIQPRNLFLSCIRLRPLNV